MIIPCPFCGPRPDVEFHYGGAAGVAYPDDPDQLTDEAWATFLYVRPNPLGPLRERWSHAGGCRRWFELERDTGTNEVLGPAQTRGGPA